MVVDYTRGTYRGNFYFADGTRGRYRYYRTTPGAQLLDIEHGLRQKSFWKQDQVWTRGERGVRDWGPGFNYLHLPGTEYHGPDEAFRKFMRTPFVVPCGHWRIGPKKGSGFNGVAPPLRVNASGCECDSGFVLVLSPIRVTAEGCECDGGETLTLPVTPEAVAEGCECDGADVVLV